MKTKHRSFKLSTKHVKGGKSTRTLDSLASFFFKSWAIFFVFFFLLIGIESFVVENNSFGIEEAQSILQSFLALTVILGILSFALGCGQLILGTLFEPHLKKGSKAKFFKFFYYFKLVFIFLTLLAYFFTYIVTLLNPAKNLVSEREGGSATTNLSQTTNSKTLYSDLYTVINEYRTSNNLSKLKVNQKLEKSSTLNLENISNSGKLDLGDNPWGNFIDGGYFYNYANILTAYDYRGSKDILNAWVKDVQLKESLTSDLYTEMGFSYKCGVSLDEKRDKCLVVLHLGSPADKYSVGSSDKPVQNYVDPQKEIINCNFPHSGTKKMTRAECKVATDCEIGDQWFVSPDHKSCDEAQEKYWDDVYEGRDFDDYEYEYEYETPSYTPIDYPNYDYEYSEKEIIYEEPKVDPTQCRNNIISYYSSLLQSCNQYGGTSVYDACREVYLDQQQDALKDCE